VNSKKRKEDGKVVAANKKAKTKDSPGVITGPDIVGLVEKPEKLVLMNPK